MLGWIFKRRSTESTSAPTAVAVSPAPEVSVPRVDWAAALALAHGDDDALLGLARAEGTPLAIKQAVVEALSGEAALKLAEREFRTHDRRVYQLAKQRLAAKVAQRRTREQAERILEDARSLIGTAEVPVNRLVELDRAWQALDAEAIETATRDEFAALTERLAAQIRGQAEVEAQRKRWLADATATLQQLQAACAEAAEGTRDRMALAAAAAAARSVQDGRPPQAEADPAGARALADLQHAVDLATALDGHVAVLDRLLAGSVEPSSNHAEHATDAGPGPGSDPAQPDWQELPPLPDPRLATLLQTRHARWQQDRDQARQVRKLQQRERAREHQRARKDQDATALGERVAQIETALDEGQLADAQRHLSDIDDQLQGADAPVALQTRLQAAQARLAQLRGWQHWAGGRARDDLVLQAEALAAATVGGEGRADGEVEQSAAVVAEVARLSIRQRADVIQSLRNRWKEIDGTGGAGAQALWRRFDAALAAAGEPVAAHMATQRAAREANLSARQQLLEDLEAVSDAAAPALEAAAGAGAPAGDEAAPQTGGDSMAHAPEHARRLATALDRFHTEWRKLGPLEHTVPRAAREALVARMAAAVSRLETPLQAARARAGAQRQALVARARALAGDVPGRDLLGSVRALQAEWQQHAKALPLGRADEQALWSEFRTAIDAAFAAREAEHSAREAEFEAHAAERAALIERLRSSLGDSPSSQRRMLAEADAAWRRCGPAPRDRAAALETEFRAACDALRRQLDDSGQRAWAATCEALDAKLALCLAGERLRAEGAEPDAAATAAAWSALPALPGPLEDALRRRAGLAPANGSVDAKDADDLLLQVETAWDLPTPPAFESARRAHKLLAMKQSLEGRRSVSPQALAPVAALARLLGCAGLDAVQQDRLAALLAAWRRQGPQRQS